MKNKEALRDLGHIEAFLKSQNKDFLLNRVADIRSALSAPSPVNADFAKWSDEEIFNLAEQCGANTSITHVTYAGVKGIAIDREEFIDFARRLLSGEKEKK